MNILGPTPLPRLNEALGVGCLFLVVFLTLSLVSYHPQDPSFNTAAAVQPRNLMGSAGAHVADLLLQTAGLAAFLFPLLVLSLAWQWIRSAPVRSPWAKVVGVLTLGVSACAALSLAPGWRVFENSIPAGGLVGLVLAEWLLGVLNLPGAVLVNSAGIVLSLYLVSGFSMYRVPGWIHGPVAVFSALREAWQSWRQERRERRSEDRALKQQRLAERVQEAGLRRQALHAESFSEPDEIPIRTLDDIQPSPAPAYTPEPAPEAEAEAALVEYATPPPGEPHQREPLRGSTAHRPGWRPPDYRLPPTDLLNEPETRGVYDAQELKEIAARVKSKFEEFNVLGSVVQINPGPVVTTFEFKPEAGIKYSRITTLTEDLCLGLQAESILIERIPGKPTVGIEVPNSRRELISLRQILESDEFSNSSSRITITLGKDISGRIRVTPLDSMPHLLIAGSTGSGKSVMLNSLIMSVLFKATPAEVRMILIDPKRVEMGIYEGVPHLLTPVITDPRKATNALRNAVTEMERRLKLLASQGVRNIDQFNRKVRQRMQEPRSLFEEDEFQDEALRPLPWVLIVIDELSDLMMIERGNVEESVTRLAQMARAVGMHLVVATQRPSVDVITGLIKANFPARVSFRVATRVDSRTILDVMGAEHLLGRGDMLFLPPGSSRLVRVHAPFVSENEINRVVEFWKQQAQPDYDQSLLLAPPEEDEAAGEADLDGAEDPLYEDAVRVVLEVGKASTSILQRRLRLGYGRAARILDMMQHEGIIGPPDGSRPREVLKRPDWLTEVQDQLR